MVFRASKDCGILCRVLELDARIRVGLERVKGDR